MNRYHPDRVSPARYRIGLVMFVLPILFGWLGPYGASHIPGYEAHRFVVSLLGDVMFVASLFVLGGDFWDKIRALFIHGAKVQINGSPMNKLWRFEERKTRQRIKPSSGASPYNCKDLQEWSMSFMPSFLGAPSRCFRGQAQNY